MTVRGVGFGSCWQPKMADATSRNMFAVGVNQGWVELSKNGVVIAQVECQNRERNCLIGDPQYEQDCCYFTLVDPKGKRIRDHYCFNFHGYINRVGFMFSDDVVVPQPPQPTRTFTLSNVEYGLHVGNGAIEISKDGEAIARLECTDEEYSQFTGITHVYKDCFYFLLGDENGKWKKLALFNPQTHFFSLSGAAVFNPHFKEDCLISVSCGGRDVRFEDVIYRYQLLQGPFFLQKQEHCITDVRGVPIKYVRLNDRDKEPLR